MAEPKARVLGPNDGKAGILGSMGVRAALADLARRYGLGMDVSSIPMLIERSGLRAPVRTAD